jgi:hypothetical protein
MCEGLISAGVCCLVDDPVSERSQWFRLIETAGPLSLEAYLTEIYILFLSHRRRKARSKIIS